MNDQWASIGGLQWTPSMALVVCVTRTRTRQPMTIGLTLLAHWPVRQKTKPC